MGADRLGRGAEGRAAAGLDLDEQQMPAVTGNNVNKVSNYVGIYTFRKKIRVYARNLSLTD